MYELLFRSRWYALAWALFMAVSAVMFTTTGAGAWFGMAKPDAQASREAHDSAFRSWAEDDKRRAAEDHGYDPSSPDRVRDGTPLSDEDMDEAHRGVPLAPGDASDSEDADGAAAE